MTNEQNNNLLKGVGILAIAGVLVKLIGAVLRIPLTNIVGTEAMAYYAVGYNIYAMLIVFATAGIPVAISKMISESIAENRYYNTQKILKISLILMTSIGVIASFACFFASSPIANFVGIPEADFTLKAVAFAVLFVTIQSTFRGYFQGFQNMTPTALSEVIEQTVRVIVGLSLAILLVSNGPQFSAAGAIFGATSGAFAGAVLLSTIYKMSKPGLAIKIKNSVKEYDDSKVILKRIVIISLPIILAAEITPIMNTIDLTIIMDRLQNSANFTYEESTELYGQFSAYCTSLVSLPQIITLSIAVSLVPIISTHYKQSNKSELNRNIRLGFKLASTLSFPAAIGMIVLARPIMELLFFNQLESALQAVPLLQIMATGIIMLGLSQTAVGVLQAIGKQHIPLRSLLVGSLFKISISFWLTGITEINVKGAALGTLVAYTVNFTLNYLAIKKHLNLKVSILKIAIAPLIASCIMGLIAFVIHLSLEEAAGNTFATLLAVLIAASAYFIIIIKVGVITKSEFLVLPKGEKIYRFLEKIKLV